MKIVSNHLELTRRGFLAAAVSTVPAVTGASIAQAATTSAGPDTVKASSFGYNPTDSTDALQAALDSSASTVVIDKVDGGWYTRPLFVRRSNVRIVFEPDVMVRAVPGVFTGDWDCLLRVEGQSNVHISGYGATLSMNKPEYTTGEWRMALRLASVQDVTVEGLVLRDSGGDGVDMGRVSRGAYSSNVVLRDLVVADNRRNGMSPGNVDGLLIEGCGFFASSGTAPQVGIDFEPDYFDDRVCNITMRDCVFEDNFIGGWLASLQNQTPESEPISILVERVKVGRQVGGGPSLQVNGVADGVRGDVEFRDCLIHVYPRSAAIGLVGKSSTGVHVTFNRTVVWDWGNTYYALEPITAKGWAKAAAYGGVTFADSLVVTDQTCPLFRAYDRDFGGLADVQGNITVVNPNPVTADYGGSPTNINLSLRQAQPGFGARVSVQSDRGSLPGGQTAHLTFTRTGGDLTPPLAVAYNVAGNARERYDYGGLGRVAVIPPGQRQTTVDVRTFARWQDSDPRTRSLVVGVDAGYGYEAEPAPAVVAIHG
jgi:hypothetical protein